MNEVISSTILPPEKGLQEVWGWFDVSQDDRARVSKLLPLAEQNIEAILQDFYAREGGYDRRGVRGHASGMQVVMEEQRRHLLELYDAGLDQKYFDGRMLAGIFNEAHGVSPSLYLSLYTYSINRICDLIQNETNEPAEALETQRALRKMAACHQAITIEAFSAARTEAIEQRERQMSELPTPALRLQEGLLLVPVVGVLDSHRSRLLTMQILDAIRDQDARVVVLDITGVAAVDSMVANHLIQTMTATRLMGAQSVLTGISAEVAQALVKIGVTGDALNPAGDLERGVATARRLLER
ncbi:protoglobin domain-containing protein [Leisingera sp. SS27]|uniref:STAS domain-containing protein n=1 Tax=Leisingera sp. SS27 TaxID=2979462 RepID=UPI00232C4847|nr:STAS domain-containing protein [Leisingera sp. SS27]MDC0658870.1 protoglobin domain-containing protein [Leisingera sp. SS27]